MWTKAAILAAIGTVGCSGLISGADPDGDRVDAGREGGIESGSGGIGNGGDGSDEDGSVNDGSVSLHDSDVEDGVPIADSGPVVKPKCGDGTVEGEARCSIDLATVVYHNSIDVSGWPVTKTITAVELAPGPSEGVKITLDPYNPAKDGDSWPDFIMWDPDTLRYTLWLFVRFGGQWHGAAVLEYWYDRTWSGAPLLVQYNDWIYANPGSPWGEMGDYIPEEGDTIGFMATAGDLRMHKDVLSVNERSNAVTVLLTGTATYTFQ